jgi:hypothetical protein
MSRAVQYSQCMRAHGVTNFPDPLTAGPGAKEAVDWNSPTFQAAQAACRQYAEPGAPTPVVQSAQREADLLRFAQCMRSHGVPTFPDPDSQGHFNIAGTGINTNSSAVVAAGRTCLPTSNGAVQPPGPTGR